MTFVFKKFFYHTQEQKNEKNGTTRNTETYKPNEKFRSCYVQRWFAFT